MTTENMLCRITPRIETICKLCAPYKSVADIGCDHAYMSIHLARSGKKVIASDISIGPLKKAKENIERFGLQKNIELRLCNGLSGYKEKETDAIIIAGMGGNVISQILQDEKKIAQTAKTLFLQPMTSSEVLRKYLYENGFSIKNEYLVAEDRRIYTIMEVVCADTLYFTELECYISKAISDKIHIPIYFEYIKNRHYEFTKVLSQIENKQAAKQLFDKYKYLTSEIEKLIS